MAAPPRTTPARPSDNVAVVRLTDIPNWRNRTTELDPVFFEASLTKSFPDEAARAAFRERWLGRFLEQWPELAHVAIASNARFIGYIIGAHADPARDGRFSDIGFYKHFAHMTANHPAHLHINLAPDARNRGVGSRLIAAFEADARQAVLPGAHLVTGRDSKNRSFYARNGYVTLAELAWGGTPIVMLGKSWTDR